MSRFVFLCLYATVNVRKKMVVYTCEKGDLLQPTELRVV